MTRRRGGDHRGRGWSDTVKEAKFSQPPVAKQGKAGLSRSLQHCERVTSHCCKPPSLGLSLEQPQETNAAHDSSNSGSGWPEIRAAALRSWHRSRASSLLPASHALQAPCFTQDHFRSPRQGDPACIPGPLHSGHHLGPQMTSLRPALTLAKFCS